MSAVVLWLPDTPVLDALLLPAEARPAAELQPAIGVLQTPCILYLIPLPTHKSVRQSSAFALHARSTRSAPPPVRLEGRHALAALDPHTTPTLSVPISPIMTSLRAHDGDSTRTC